MTDITHHNMTEQEPVITTTETTQMDVIIGVVMGVTLMLCR